MSIAETNEAQVFLELFFGDNNELKLNHIERSEGPARLILPWINRLKLAVPLPSVLPHKYLDEAGATKYNWYAVARSGRELRDLNENLMAFVGPTWSTFRGQSTQLDKDNPLEEAVLRYSRGFALKFTGDEKKIWERLELMRRVLWEEYKPAPPDDVRPSGRVLRDFNIALQVQHRENAEDALRILQHQHGYDAINISFLKVQMFAAFGKWKELLEPNNLTDLMLIRRPTAVTQTLIEAVYREELKVFEEAGDTVEALQHFRRQVLPRYGSLYSIPSAMDSPNVVKSFALFALSSDPADVHFLGQISEFQNLEPNEKAYLEKLVAMRLGDVEVEKKTEILTIDQNAILQKAKEIFWEGDFKNSLRLALDSPNSIQRVQILLSCAFELQTLDAQRKAVNAFQLLPAEDQNALWASRAFRTTLESIVGTNQDSLFGSTAIEIVPRDWTEWLKRLYSEPSWTRARDVARLGVSEWNVESFLHEELNINKFEETLKSYTSAAETAIFDCLPYLFEFFKRDVKFPRRNCGNVYSLLLYLLTISTNGGEDDLVLFNETLEAVLLLGVERQEYVELLSNAEDLWGDYASPSNLDWALDLIDYLIQYPCPDEGKRRSLLNMVVNSLPTFARRIEPAQWDFLSFLIKDLGSHDLFSLVEQYRRSEDQSAVSDVPVLTYLNGKMITIHTLTESVARRVKDVIELACHNVTVNLSHDKVGSERLRQWSRNSDVLVMVTGSAKHAATEFIEANRGGLPILRPLGKGSASVLREIRRFLVEQINT